MSWAFLLIAIPTACYLGAAVAYGIRGEWPNAIIFSGYFWANCGFLAIELMRAKA